MNLLPCHCNFCRSSESNSISSNENIYNNNGEICRNKRNINGCCCYNKQCQKQCNQSNSYMADGEGVGSGSRKHWDDDCHDNCAVMSSDSVHKQVHVHCGFWRRYVNLKEKIQHSLQQLFYENNVNMCEWTLILTGHSLGSTTALFTAACLPLFLHNTRQANANISVCFFGSPPCCCRALEDVLNSRGITEIYNISNRFDIVTTEWFYPPWLHHHGTRITNPVHMKHFLSAHFPSAYRESMEMQYEQERGKGTGTMAQMLNSE